MRNSYDLKAEQYDNGGFIDDGGPPTKNGVNGFHNSHVTPDDLLRDLPKGNGKKEEKEEKEKVKQVGFFELFRFADPMDFALILGGILTGIAVGCSIPAVIVIFGNMTDNFITEGAIVNVIDENWEEISELCPNQTQEEVRDEYDCLVDYLNGTTSNVTEDYQWIIDGLEDDFIAEMNERTYYYIVLGGIVMITGYITIACFMSMAYRQGQRIRTFLFHAILRQEIGWFDTHNSGELNTRLADDVSKIQEGLGDKLSAFLRYSAQFIGGYGVGFYYGWELTLVISAASPLIIIAGGIMSQLGVIMTGKELKAYAKAGAVAEEVLSSVRTVVAFGGEEKEVDRYNGNLTEARDYGVKKSMISGLGSGLVYMILFSSYGLAFWYGSRLVRDSLRNANDEYTAGVMLTVFYGVLVGAFAVGIAAPNLAYLSTARGAAYTVFQIIDMKPSIDSSSKKGKKLEKITGNIEFKNVHFKYPSRPDVPILNGLNLKINVGQTVALVGSSGCGKSTSVQLIQRFYDPAQGKVLIDGVDIKEFNVQWLRQHIGVVSQEPILFATTIGENIRYGKEGVTQQDIETAAKNANAHDFIMKLPKKYDTQVGERGAQLSGGQKQRIAIARAVVRDPKILLLDEATSALDMESEAIVQEALDKARAGRTTLVIAHRLSTIRSADVICGVSKGVITEQGTHDELMGLGGIYYTLCTNQSLKEQEEKEQLALGLKQADEFEKSPLDRNLSRASTKRQLSRGMSIASDKGDEEDDKDLKIPSFFEIMRLNAQEWPFIFFGCIGAFVTGVLQPTFAYVFSEVITVFANPDLEEQEDEANLYSLLFVVIGVANGISMFLEGYFFGKSGETLTWRLRRMCFEGFLKQRMAYFDDEHHGTGALCTRLANDASTVQGATGAQLGMLIRSLSSLLGGMVIGFVYSWKLTLVFLSFAPFLVAGGFLEMALVKGSAQADKEALENAGKIAVEAVETIRTVATLTKEEMFHADYTHSTNVPYKKNMRSVHLRALAFGISQSFIFFAMAGGFRYGAYLIEEEGLSTEDMFKVFGAIVFSAMLAGQVSAFGPDVGKAKLAAGRILALFAGDSNEETDFAKGFKPQSVSGYVSFRDVKFNYPTRPNVKILQGLNIQVNPGQTLALVGASGCGKSTSIQLIERFYDPREGAVELDGSDVSGLNVKWLRQQMGLVSQEPILFDASIADNIAYGDNSRHVPMDEIIQAAREANIHSFITTLPNGYSTNCGAKGTQLSGGQKQRIAIARALVRNPKILLLDEATSALDTESEKVVQEALDNARSGRTSIVIAHRLSTIYNADIIAVIHNGKVAEQGTHSELLAHKGLYYKLNTIQNKA